jgi:hypothetical protein
MKAFAQAILESYHHPETVEPFVRRPRRRSPFAGILPGNTVGALSELRVAVDLLENGFEVFRALSPACSCDLIACKNGRTIRVEVRTGYRNGDGTFGCPRKHRADVLAVAIEIENVIVYDPPLE